MIFTALSGFGDTTDGDALCAGIGGGSYVKTTKTTYTRVFGGDNNTFKSRHSLIGCQLSIKPHQT